LKKQRNLSNQVKATKRQRFVDLEDDRGMTEIQAPAASHRTWFDPDGAMNSKNSAKRISANVPILWIVAKNDYEGLRQADIPMFNMFPPAAKARLYEPATDHHNVPRDSADEIIEWISEISNS
jgi:hypothetical protein